MSSQAMDIDDLSTGGGGQGGGGAEVQAVAVEKAQGTGSTAKLPPVIDEKQLAELKWKLKEKRGLWHPVHPRRVHF